MTRWLEDIMTRYGQTVTVERDGAAETVQAFIQPLSERNETLPEAQSPLGWTDGRLWLYLGRAAAEAGNAVAWNGMRFRVRSGRPFFIGAALSHWRAILEREKETRTCGN